MCDVWDIGFKGWRDGEINYVRIQLDGTVDRLENEVELMQHTGLKDKNGKEIYEEDILECDSGSLWRVYWAEGIGGFRLELTGNEDYCDFVDLDLYKIIGNICENSELLEEGK